MYVCIYLFIYKVKKKKKRQNLIVAPKIQFSRLQFPVLVVICQLPKRCFGTFEVQVCAQAQEGALLLVLLTGKEENNSVKKWRGINRIWRGINKISSYGKGVSSRVFPAEP